MRAALFVIALLAIGHVRISAQYEVGLSGGVFHAAMSTSRNSRGGGSFGPGDVMPYTVGVWYRERSAKRVGLGLGGQWTHRSFRADYTTGGLGYGSNYETAVNADFVHAYVGLEVRLDGKGRLNLRTGPQFGFFVGGNARGTYSGWSTLSPSDSETFRQDDLDYHGDVRWFLGFGFWSALHQRLSLSVDPYASVSITPMKEDDPRFMSIDFGLNVSVGLRMKRRTLWETVRAGAPNTP